MPLTMSASSTIRVGGLGKQKLAAMRRQARRLGLSLEGYAKHLIEEGLSLEQVARSKTFDELYASAQARMKRGEVSEGELDKLVDRARTRYQQRTSGNRS